jgi:hypothetical protein
MDVVPLQGQTPAIVSTDSAGSDHRDSHDAFLLGSWVRAAGPTIASWTATPSCRGRRPVPRLGEEPVSL